MYSTSSRGRFLREAKLQGRLEHPSVVPIPVGVDARARPANLARLARVAVFVGGALIATTPVEAANLDAGTLAAHRAARFVHKLTDVADQRAGVGVAHLYAALARRAIAR
jgi:hypothetical protein